MQTHVGRMIVCTMAISSGAFVIWETVILVYPHAGHSRWWQVIPEAEVMERTLTHWDGWIAHALVVGWLRVGYELEAPPRRVKPIGEPFAGRLTEALGLPVVVHKRGVSVAA